MKNKYQGVDLDKLYFSSFIFQWDFLELNFTAGLCFHECQERISEFHELINTAHYYSLTISRISIAKTTIWSYWLKPGSTD